MSKPYSSRIADKFVIRLLDGMREQIKDISDKQHRSMNSELVAWIEMMLEVYKETGTVPSLDSLRSNAETAAQNAAMRVLFERLLDAGSWYMSAVEFDSHDHHVDGEKFEEEIKALLAQPTPNAGFVVQQVKAPDLPPAKPRFKPGKDEPVALYINGKYKLGVVKKIWVDTYGGFEEFKARVELNGGGCTEVPLRTLEEPDHL